MEIPRRHPLHNTRFCGKVGEVYEKFLEEQKNKWRAKP